MSDEKALLAAIWEHPHEDTPRLVYADWLQENGQPERAEFIRVQCEMAKLAEDDPRFRTARAASNRLSKKWGAKWKATLPRNARTGQWHQGFFQPDDRGIQLAALLRMPTRELLAAPTRSFSVMDAADRFDDLLAWPFLDRLNTFYLRERVPAGNWLERALNCRDFCNVCKISLIGCPVRVSELETLLTAWQARRIVEIHLGGSKIGDEGLRVLLSHPVLPDVRELGISGIGLTASGVRALADSSYRPPVPDLTLAWNPIGDAGIAELVRWSGLGRIRKLGLNDTEITDAGATALAECPALRALEELWLGHNRISASGANALAVSPNLAKLDELYIHDNPIPADALRSLRARFGQRLKSPREGE